MALAFTLEDVLSGRPISVDSALVGISEEEHQRAIEWIRKLRDVEQRNVVGSLATVLSSKQYKAYLTRPIGFAVVAVGSSLYTSNYNDIDILIVPETFDHGKFMQQTSLLRSMGEVLQGDPEGFWTTSLENWQGFNCIFCFEDYEPGNRPGKDEKVHGKQIQMYLLLDKFDFEFPREGKEGDIIYRPGLNAEQLIELNRRNGTCMLMLGRSYVLGNDYSQSIAGSLDIKPSEVIDLYAKVIKDAMSDGDEIIKTIKLIVDSDFQIYILENSVLPATPLKLRKQLRATVIGALKTHFGEDGLGLDRRITNYADALINQKIKKTYKLE